MLQKNASFNWEGLFTLLHTLNVNYTKFLTKKVEK